MSDKKNIKIDGIDKILKDSNPKRSKKNSLEFNQIMQSLEKGLYYDAIPIINTVLFETMKERIDWIENNIFKNGGTIFFSRTVSQATKHLSGILTKKDKSIGLERLIDKIEKWSYESSAVVSEMEENYEKDIIEQLKSDPCEVSAIEGFKLLNRLRKLVKQLNK